MKRKWEKVLFSFLHPRHWTWKVQKHEACCGCTIYEWLCFDVEFIAMECWRYGKDDKDTVGEQAED